MINYNGLFDILERKNMKKTDLLEIVSSGTLAKLNKNQNIQTEIIDKICKFLNVQPGEIMEYYNICEISLIEETSILYKAGYKQIIKIDYPSENDEYSDITRSEFLISKKIYQNTEKIKKGEINIPKTFIKEYEAYIKEPYLKQKINEVATNK